MVDTETRVNDLAGESNTSAAAIPAPPEPQILEETVIHKIAAPVQKTSPAEAPKFAPIPVVKGMAVPPKTILTPETPVAAAAGEMPEPPAIPVAATPAAPTLPPKPLFAPEQPAANVGASSLNADIAKILGDVKLPERRESAEIKLPAEVSPKTFDTALGTKTEHEEKGGGKEAVPAAVTPQSAEKKANSITAVHTLRDDLQHVVRDQKISVVSAVSLEEKRRFRQEAASEETTPKEKRGRRTSVIVFSVVILLMLGLAALFGVYTIMQQHSGQSAPPPTSSILFAESSVVFPLDNQPPKDLKRILGNARDAQNRALGSITRIIPTVTTQSSGEARPATFGEFMAALETRAPDDLVRALGSDFFFGIHTVDKNAPVLIIPVVSYDRAFAAMLAWENTMNADLAPAFTPLSVLTTDQNGVPTKRLFQDLIIRNYDVRALKDDAGNIELYYSFPTQKILIIAESPYTFTEVLSRLQAERKL